MAYLYWCDNCGEEYRSGRVSSTVICPSCSEKLTVDDTDKMTSKKIKVKTENIDKYLKELESEKSLLINK